MIKEGYIFIHIPKTAGRSICSVLDWDFKRDHKTIADYCREIGESSVRNRFKFACVRNPWDRAVSWWAFFGNMGFDRTPFDQWLKKLSCRPRLNPAQRFPLDQMSYCRTQSGEVLIDSFLRFESLADDWEAISSRLGVSGTLPAIGKQDRMNRIQMRDSLIKSSRPEFAPMVPSEDYHDMYSTKQSIDIVASLDAETIKRFGYTFK